MSIVGIDPSSEVSPYEQVRAQIAGHVAAGRMTAGHRLPTVRALATELGLAVNTVARAYRELEADGIVATEGRRGTFVRSRHLGEASGDARAAAERFADAGRRAGLSRAEATRLVEQAWDRGARP